LPRARNTMIASRRRRRCRCSSSNWRSSDGAGGGSGGGVDGGPAVLAYDTAAVVGHVRHNNCRSHRQRLDPICERRAKHRKIVTLPRAGCRKIVNNGALAAVVANAVVVAVVVVVVGVRAAVLAFALLGRRLGVGANTREIKQVDGNVIAIQKHVVIHRVEVRAVAAAR
jgi:hypothetical protein